MKLCTTLRELGGTVKDRLAVGPGIFSGFDGYCFFRDQFFERRTIAGKVRSPDSFTRVKQALL